MKMKNIVNIIIALLCNVCLAQDFLKVSNGCSSIQIKVKNSSVGYLYYVIYKTDVSTAPTGAELKALASSSTTTNIERKDKITLNTSNYNDTIVRSIINIPAVTSNTPKLLYSYTVFENADGSFGIVNRQVLTFTRKQPPYTFQSTTLNAPQLTTVNYLVYLPESYYHNPNKKYPMIVFFHGDGQKGDNVDQVRTDALPNYLDGTMSLDFIVISPQQNGWKQTWDKPSFVQELIDLSKNQYRVDDQKVYGIGCSGGGGGMYRYTLAYPQNLVAIAPFSGTNIFNGNICTIKDIPFWGFHSLNDGTVVYNGFNNIVNDLTACVPLEPYITAVLTIAGNGA
jgi:predicted esterase